MSSRLEQRIINLERLTFEASRRTDKVLAQLGQVGQALRLVRAGGGKVYGLTTFKGRVIGIADQLLPHSLIRIEGDEFGTNTDYGTYEAVDGTFEFSIPLPENRVWIYYQGPTERFQERRLNYYPNFGEVNELADISAQKDYDGDDDWDGIATNYSACHAINVPLWNLLNFEDSRYAITNTMFATIPGGQSSWLREFISLNHSYGFVGIEDNVSGYQLRVVKPGPFGGIGNNWSTATSSLVIASLPDGTPGGPKFDATWTWTSTDPARSYTAGDTIRIWEP